MFSSSNGVCNSLKSIQKKEEAFQKKGGCVKHGKDGKVNSSVKLFENLIPAKQAASMLGRSIDTIYDWHYRGKLKKIPDDLFLKINRMLYVRMDVMQEWIASQNPSLRDKGGNV